MTKSYIILSKEDLKKKRCYVMLCLVEVILVIVILFFCVLIIYIYNIYLSLGDFRLQTFFFGSLCVGRKFFSPLLSWRNVRFVERNTFLTHSFYSIIIIASKGRQQLDIYDYYYLTGTFLFVTCKDDNVKCFMDR